MNGLRAICRMLSQATRLLLLSSLLASPTFARDVLHALNPAGATEVSFKDASGHLIVVTVTESKLDSSYLYHNAILWGGDVGVLPQSVVSELRIRMDQKLIFVPLSAFGDLGDVMSVSFSSIARGFRVSFHGGNTAASYDATLLFERGVLLRREVRLRELPDERWEKARYGFPSAGR